MLISLSINCNLCHLCRLELLELPAGVSLAMIARAYGCRCHVAMPDDAAQEKSLLLEALGMG